MSRFDGNIVVGTSVDVGGINTGLNKITSSFSRLARSVSNSALVNLFTKAASAASDLVEVQNVVDVSFENMSWKAERFAKNAIKQFGMSELAAKQTAGSFMAMGKAADLGMENASNMAVNLSALTGDFASFYNISQEYARVALSAVYTGETETLKRYGIILTEANLQAYATTQGIEKQVKAMNAREKLILRYMYVMDKTQDIQGDFVRTQDSFANQTRLLSQTWTQFLQVLGNGVTTVLAPVLKVISQLIVKLRQFTMIVLSIIGNIFGIDFSMPTSEMEGYSDAVDDAAEAEEELADDIGKSRKAAMKAIAPFDELNVLRTPSSSGGKAGGADIFGDFNADLLYDWPDVVDDIFSSTIDNFYDFGRWLSTGFAEILDSIPWDSIFNVARQFGINLSDFLNGLIDPNTFTELGETLANGLNTVIYSIQSFAHNFKWEQAGQAISNFINTLFSTFDFESAADTINTLAKGLRDMFVTAIGLIEWDEIADKIKNFISKIDWRVKLVAFGAILAAGLAFLFKTVLMPTLTFLIRKLIGTLFKEVVVKALEAKFGKGLVPVLKGIFATLGTKVILPAILAIIAAISGYFAGKNLLGPLFFPEDKDYYKDFTLFKFIKQLVNTDLATLGKSIKALLTDLDSIAVMFVPIGAFIGSILRLIDSIKSKDITGTIAALFDTVLNGIGLIIPPFGMFLNTLQLVLRILKSKNVKFKLFESLLESLDKIGLGIEDQKKYITTFFKFVSGIFSDMATIANFFIELILKKIKSEISVSINILSAFLKFIINDITKTYNNISSIINSLITLFVNVIFSISDIVIKGASNIVEFAKSVIFIIVDSIKSFNSTIVQLASILVSNVLSYISGLVTSITQPLNIILQIVFKCFEGINTIAYNCLSAVWSVITNLVTNIATVVQNLFNAILKAFPDFVSKITEGLKPIIDTLNNIIKAAAEAANTQVNPIPGPVTGHSNTTSPNVNTGSKPSLKPKGPSKIARLAMGAVIPPNAPFLAMLGDQTSGTNVEAPLDTIKQALVEALASNGFGGNNDIIIPITIDGREIARAVAKQNDIFKRSTGRSLI